MDGRLGVAPAAHAGPRLVRRRARAARASCAASTSTPASSPATIRRTARSTRSTATRAVTPELAAQKARPGRRFCRGSPLDGEQPQLLPDPGGRSGRGAAVDAPPPQHLSGRRRRAAARLRRRRCRLDARPGARRRCIDLASIANGGLVLGASDMHFGAKDNMIMPGRARNMGDGWETRRRRGPGHDWAIVRLGAAGVISRIEIDTNHFKGNYPDSASIEACFAPGATLDELRGASWVRAPAADEAAAAPPAFLRARAAADGPVVARAPEHLSRRRREPTAESMEPWQRLDLAAAGRGARPAAKLLRRVRAGSSA